MSSNIEDHQVGRVRYYGAQIGVVVDNVDPRGLHRVRAQVPGICDPYSDWLWPLTLGGGSPQRGGHVVPRVGADLVVWFHQGDPHGRGWYAAGNWGIPEAGSEMPGDVLDAGTTNPELVQALQFPDAPAAGAAPGAPVSGLRITVDERPGQRAFQVLDVDASGVVQCAFVLDREQRAILLQAVSQIVIQCDGVVVVNGLEVQVNGRRVQPSPAQI
jgi:hypothetical protein